MTRLTDKELAERWGLTVRALQMMRKAGTGPTFVRPSPRVVFYRLADIEAYEDLSMVNRRPEWRSAVKRAAAALDLQAKKAATDKARETLTTLRDDLRALLK